MMFERGKRYLFMTLAFHYEAVVEECDAAFVYLREGTVKSVNETGDWPAGLSKKGKWKDSEAIPTAGAVGLGHIVAWWGPIE